MRRMTSRRRNAGLVATGMLITGVTAWVGAEPQRQSRPPKMTSCRLARGAPSCALPARRATTSTKSRSSPGYYTREQWHDVVVTMVEYGAPLAAQEIEVLADYLDEHLGRRD
jgi:hypothetical protein